MAEYRELRFETTATYRRDSRGPGRDAGLDEKAFAEADVLTVHFADGSELHTNPGDFAGQYAQHGLEARGVRANGEGTARVLLPFDLPIGKGLATRGGSRSTPVAEYRLARLTERSWLDKVYDAAASIGGAGSSGDAVPGVAMAAAEICRWYENRVLDKRIGNDTGLLLRWRDGEWQEARSFPEDVRKRAEDHPVLILLHGTASSTHGSFAGLWTASRDATAGATAATSARAAIDRHWQRLSERMEILAFEHRSLTASPVRNALDLLATLDSLGLPDKAEINIVSHSRGGLVGEFLSMALSGGEQREGRQRDDAFPVDERLRILKQVFLGGDEIDGAYPHRHADRQQVDDWFKGLDSNGARGPGRPWIAKTFVRVACPARGTLLADHRTDLFLSLLLHSVGLAVGSKTNPVYETFSGLVKGLVACRADAKWIPGLEAQIPGGPLSIALNRVGEHVEPLTTAPRAAAGHGTSDPQRPLVLPGSLRIVAGNNGGCGWSGLLGLLGDVFYGLHDHDFVVHTHSMFGGLPRLAPRSLRVEDRSVNHFGYFAPKGATRASILAALERDDSERDDGSFQSWKTDEARTRGLMQAFAVGAASRRPLEESLKLIERGSQANDGKSRTPIVLLLPGIMGSELTLDKAGRTWLSLPALLNGGLAKLELAAGSAGDDPDVDKETATGLMPVAYERLLDRWSRRFRVVPWPYDWRRPILRSAARLRKLFDTLLRIADSHGVPVHVIAHSMGGLVVRAAFFHEEFGDGAGDAKDALWQRFCKRGGRVLMLGTPNLGSYAPAQLLLKQHPATRLLAAAALGVSLDRLTSFGAGFQGLLEMLPAADENFGGLFDPDTWRRLAQTDGRVTRPEEAALARAAGFNKWLEDSMPALKQRTEIFYVAGQGLTPIRLLARSAGEPLAFQLSPFGDGVVPWTGALAAERTWYLPAAHGDLADCTDAFDAYAELLNTGQTRSLSQQPPDTARTRAARDGVEVLRIPSLPSLPEDPSAFVLGVSAITSAPLDPPPILVHVVHGCLDYARYPLMVGHYREDLPMGALRRVDSKLDGQFSRVMSMRLFNGTARTAVYLRRPTRGVEDRLPPPYPGAIVLGLGDREDLTPALLADIVAQGVLQYAFEHGARDPWAAGENPLLLRLATVLIGTNMQTLRPRDSLASILSGVSRANQFLLASSPPPAGRPVRVAELEIIELEEAVALDAGHQLAALMQSNGLGRRFTWSSGTLETREGALRGYLSQDTDGAWQRLIVRNAELGGLKFDLIADRARVESTQVHAAVASLKHYVQRVADEGADGRGDPDEQESLGGVLFHLLLPQELKGRLANFQQTVLVVDDDAACLPWELMRAPARGGIDLEGHKPLAVQAGMVRQRFIREVRPIAAPIGQWNALVIGEPDTGGWIDEAGKSLVFGALPGARAEAARIAETLENDTRPWRVKRLFAAGESRDGTRAPSGPGFERVRTALFERSWRVLHLCGHGVVDQWLSVDTSDPDRRRAIRGTGMVLNSQQLLQPGDVEQMDPAPEFVFINCCYSGRDTAAAGVARHDPKLAASLAMQFIRMGTRAVVAAGWRVEDDAALLFADTLYRELLSGSRFGEAVHAARQAVYDDASSGARGNTWGAYQCYGDPQWRLFETVSSMRSAAGQRSIESQRLAEAEKCLSEFELAARILEVPAIAGDTESGVLARQLDDLVRTLSEDPRRADWLDSSRVNAALAEAYYALGAWQHAVRFLRASVGAAKSRASMESIENAANALSRLAPQGSIPALDQLLGALDGLDLDDKEFEGSKIADGSSIGDVARFGKAERACLRGGHAYRRASDCGGRQQIESFIDSAQFYASAYQIRRPEGRRRDKPSNRAYALSNALVSGASAAWLDEKKREEYRSMQWVTGSGANGADWKQEVAQLIRELESGGDRHDFWSYTSVMDLMWAQWMMEAALGGCPTLDESIFHRLDCALERYRKPSQLDSVRAKLKAAAKLLHETPASCERAADSPAASGSGGAEADSPATETDGGANADALDGAKTLAQLLDKCLERIEEFEERQRRPL